MNSEENLCLAVTGSGNSCNNTAIYPEDDPKACYIKSHQEQMDKPVLSDIDDLKELEKELEQNLKPPLKDIKAKRWVTKTMYVI